MKFPAASNGVSSIILQNSLQAAENALKGIQKTSLLRVNSSHSVIHIQYSERRISFSGI
jgi:hypothetical protein